MDPLSSILSWARSRGIELHGIELRAIPGRGYGVLAARDLQVDDPLLVVPTATLHQPRSVPAPTRRRLAWSAASSKSGVTVHGLLAADLWLRPNRTVEGVNANDTEASSNGSTESTETDSPRAPKRRKTHKAANPALPDPWTAVLPSPSDLAAAMPVLWPAALRRLLPPAARELVEKQRQKLEKDWNAVRTAFDVGGGARDIIEARRARKSKAKLKRKPADKNLSTSEKDAYTYSWLIVNTRTFYFMHPLDLETGDSKLAREDRMALQPMADLFNHHGEAPDPASTASSVSFDPDGFTIRASRRYEKGEEVCISYGTHSNDFLLAEYGFILDDNYFDEVSLDVDVILPNLSAGQRSELEDVGFFGKYVLDARTPACYRTEIAMRLMCCEGDPVQLDRWRQLVKGEEPKAGEADDEDVRWKRRLASLLRAHLEVVDKRIVSVEAAGKLKGGSGGLEAQRDTLKRRWRQIHVLMEKAIVQLEPSGSEEAG